METYRAEQLLTLAKRHHNTKRTYLLVNPLQGKHIPVSPTQSLTMLRTLGQRFAAAAPEVDLVIGFAETATAVGAVVAEMLPQPCFYIHTTREPATLTAESIGFREEHSHAAEQFLLTESLRPWLENARSIAFADDELSTGKTLLNIIHALRERFPCLLQKPLWAVSVINRLTEARETAMQTEGVRCFSLLKLPLTDLTSQVEKYAIRAPIAPTPTDEMQPVVQLPPTTEDPRRGCRIADFTAQCRRLSEAVYACLGTVFKGKRVTVLGTEEWMLPGLLLGEYIERRGEAASVRFHATTRSPIGICSASEYPIQSGVSLHSFYESERPAFLYNLQPDDVVIVLTDSTEEAAIRQASAELCGAYASLGCTKLFFIKESRHVWHL